MKEASSRSGTAKWNHQ